MDFGFSEEQELLRQSARDFLTQECPMTLVRKMMDDEAGHSPELWKKMAELGTPLVGGTPEEFRAFVAKEIDKWAEAVKVSGATAE